MADGHRKGAWLRTAKICETMANCHKDPDRRPYTVDDFNPFAKRAPKAVAKAPITILKSIFLSQ